jgi:hypothetical protein
MKIKTTSMFLEKTVFVFVCILLSVNSFSQDIFSVLSSPNVHGAKVTVVQSESIKILMDRTHVQNKAMGDKIPGFRIQLFSDYKADARERALKLRADFISLFPNFDPVRVYSSYEPPFIKVRVGDYRDENSALIDYKKFVKDFPDCYIVKTTIHYPPLGQ